MSAHVRPTVKLEDGRLVIEQVILDTPPIRERVVADPIEFLDDVLKAIEKGS